MLVTSVLANLVLDSLLVNYRLICTKYRLHIQIFGMGICVRGEIVTKYTEHVSNFTLKLNLLAKPVEAKLGLLMKASTDRQL